ncbi:hypothetical protein FHT80_005993 [Rhizobium sp. BK226]|nr:hypothetical protein [Rhizobium sp. BK112]MBB3366625.1 hypothetical protein [Rhizobium sp. BK077]MBB3745835.1 hypothetical protein [Rhizobium sp. BK591]MBB4116616.1 hypothetical protein [Rhizobium sp. BK226]MBB4218555.1 hypothetical protein [Rhizobium sp. BK212]
MTQGNIFNTMCIGGNDLPVQILHAGEMIWVLRYELA